MFAPPRPRSAGDARHLRRLNLERLLAIAMDRTGPFTRSELIRETELSAPTVGSLTAELLRQGLLKDLGSGPSRGGRRPGLLEFDARFGVVAGIALGARQTHLAVADLRGEVLALRSLATRTDIGARPLLGEIAAELGELLRDVDGGSARLVTVAAGAPGAVDALEGRVVALTPNLKGWSQVPMAAILARKLRAPVSVENDINLAMLGEHWRGAARGHRTCAFIWVGTGIGAGIMVDGVLHRGHHFLAGEIALMCMGPQYVDRDFGQRGCLETLASLHAIEARWRPARGRRARDDGGDLLEAAGRGDRRAERALREAATLLGIAATNLSLVVDPSLLVFGGPLMPRSAILLDEVRRIVRRVIPKPPEIVASSLGSSAAVWGSLLVATSQARVRLRESLGAVAAEAGAVSAKARRRPDRSHARGRRARAG